MITVYNRKHITWDETGEIAIDHFEFFLDDSGDLAELQEMSPYYTNEDGTRYQISQGSLAYDISSATMYMMQTDGDWIEQ